GGGRGGGWGGQRVVGVDVENETSARSSESFVAGSGKVVAPSVIEEAGAELASNVRASVGRACIDDDDLVNDVPDRGEAVGEDCLLVPDDHRGADPHAACPWG